METTVTDASALNTIGPDHSATAAGINGTFTKIGIGVLRYGLVGILLYYGFAKFFPFEAEGIKPLVSNSPLMSWMYSVLSLQAVSNVIGTTEIILAILIGLRFVSGRLSAAGSIGAIVMTLTTLTFLFSTPGAWISVPGFPLPVTSATGAFLIKDIFLLGAAIVS
ncbi:MAG: DUF417 family protein, partial [Acidobacteriota bacterium]